MEGLDRGRGSWATEVTFLGGWVPTGGEKSDGFGSKGNGWDKECVCVCCGGARRGGV